MKLKYKLPAIICFLLPIAVLAQETAPKAVSASEDNTLRYVLMGVAIFLALAIVGVGILLNYFIDINKKEASNSNSIIKTIALIIGSSIISIQSFAQETVEKTEEAVAAVKEPAFWNFPTDISILFAVIIIECFVILYLLHLCKKLNFYKKAVATQEMDATGKFKMKTFFQKVNDTVALEDEHTIDLQHDYDGIRELNNKIPRWWSLSFLLTVVIAIVYLYRFYISETFPLQLDELKMENVKAEKKMKEYLKNSGNNVDENTVKMADAAGITEGSELYTKNCAACHGYKGEGTIGPNLTDKFWVHDGDLKGIFYSIKYGWVEKGMKAWKDDFSPIQIQNITSYIKSIEGTNPPNAKAPEGKEFVAAAATDAAATDSTASAAK